MNNRGQEQTPVIKLDHKFYNRDQWSILNSDVNCASMSNQMSWIPDAARAFHEMVQAQGSTAGTAVFGVEQASLEDPLSKIAEPTSSTAAKAKETKAQAAAA